MDQNIVLITTTVATEEHAHKIAQDLLDTRTVACVQIQPVSSSYWENNAIKKVNEWHLMIKTSRNMIKQALEELLKVHPYDIPEIIVEDVKTHNKYHDWVEEQIRLSSRYYKK